MRAVWLLILAIALGGGYWAWNAFESDPPRIQTRTSLEHVGQKHVHEFTVVDAGRGVEQLRVWVEAGDEQVELSSARYDGSWHSGAEPRMPRSIQVAVEPAAQGLPDGRGMLYAEATDFSFRRNTTRVAVPILIDTRQPRVTVLTGLTYIRHGGSELVVYELDEESPRHGVQVGETFFPGYVHPTRPKQFAAFYALPHDAPRDSPIAVVAADRAGNERSVPLSVSVLPGQATTDQIPLSESFMRTKVAEISGEPADDVLAGYLKLNRQVRAENAETLRQLCSKSSEDRLWTGPFLQMPNSKVGAGFAEARTYTYEGQEVDRQTHLGFDLASTARAEIPAANDGVVVFAADLGIYGRTVVIDHGLSLFSLYGHLSELAVEKGQAVARGQTLGRSGTTGLAGGDHLHYAMLLAGTFVDPLEWFDGRWIQEHLEGKLETAPESAPAAAPASDARARPGAPRL